jgi:hypothetical protein
MSGKYRGLSDPLSLQQGTIKGPLKYRLYGRSLSPMLISLSPVLLIHVPAIGKKQYRM